MSSIAEDGDASMKTVGSLTDAELDGVVNALQSGDESASTALSERYRRELHLHCYRMLGTLEDAEDLVQETLLRAWRNRASCEGRSSFRAWLYRIATNACLDTLDGRPERRPRASGPNAEVASIGEVLWLQPFSSRSPAVLQPF